MRVVSVETDLLDRMTIVVDRDANPVDLDEALLDFLDKIVDRRLSQRKQPTSAGAPAAEWSTNTSGAKGTNNVTV
jgi:hypothetical protein